MLSRLQNFLLLKLYPVRGLAWPLIVIGLLCFPALILAAIIQPELEADTLFIGWVTGLGLMLFGVLLSLSRSEALPAKGFRSSIKRLWETLVFWVWLICLVVFLSLAIKIITLAG